MSGIFVIGWLIKRQNFGYKYGTPENRPAKIRNPNDIGALCKHLTSLLSNKRWLQQITSILMDFIVKNIDRVNEFLRRVPGQEFTVPDKTARDLGKQGVYKKFFNRQELIQSIANDFIKEAGDKLFSINLNLDDDLQRFINNSEYQYQKISNEELKVIRDVINNYIQDNTEQEDVEEENNNEEET